MSKHVFLREWIHTAKDVEMGCISYFCVFSLFPYDSNASRMEPKAYHYQDLFFCDGYLGKMRDFKMNRFT